MEYNGRVDLIDYRFISQSFQKEKYIQIGEVWSKMELQEKIFSACSESGWKLIGK